MYVIIESGDACTAVKDITLLLMVTVLQCTCIYVCMHHRYYLERSNSAKLTLKRAKELYPMEVMPHQAFSLSVIVL